MKKLWLCLFLGLTACNFEDPSDSDQAKIESELEGVKAELKEIEAELEEIELEEEEILPEIEPLQEVDLTVDDVIAMHNAGVRMAMAGESAVQVVPQDLSPEELINAEVLDFNGSKIYALPGWLLKFKQLRKLILNNAGLPLTELVKLKALTTLEVLNISGNLAITSTGDDAKNKKQPVKRRSARQLVVLSELDQLTELDLSHNQLTEIASLKLDKLKNLRKLNLSFNEIKVFRPRMIAMASIEVLNLQHNQLDKFPFEGDMPELVSLNLSENNHGLNDLPLKIDEAYAGVFAIKKITQLDLSHNAYVHLHLNIKKKLLHNSGNIAGKYKVNSGKTIIDMETNLEWMQCSLGQAFSEGEQTLFQCIGEVKRYNWEQALKSAQNFSYAGYSDWRLPSREELLTLVYCSSGQPETWNTTTQACKGNFKHPTIISEIFPNTPSTWYWSFAEHPIREYYAPFVYFGDGNSGDGSKSHMNPVRLVRGGK